eukprot:scaffold589648_cov18-Prasinocladus_malaysianus.AAC.1
MARTRILVRVLSQSPSSRLQTTCPVMLTSWLHRAWSMLLDVQLCTAVTSRYSVTRYRTVFVPISVLVITIAYYEYGYRSIGLCVDMKYLY